MKKERVIWFLLLMAFMGVTIAGCGKINHNGSKQSDDGRSYDGLIEGKIKETQHTAFFDLTVEKIEYKDTCQFKDSLYEAEDGKVYMYVTLKLKNTYARNLSMSVTDFPLFSDADKDNLIYGFGKSDISQDEMMDTVFSLKQGEEVTKSVVYVVSKDDFYRLKYTEYYEDDFIGNTFEIPLTESTK